MTRNFSIKSQLKKSAETRSRIRVPRHFAPTRLTFNFSFLTADKKYNFNNSGSNKNVKSTFLNTILRLSSDDLVAVLGYPRETGLEKIRESSMHFSLNREFVKSDRSKDCLDGLWVFRINNKGRVIGKIQNTTFYIMGIDTSFDVYRHGN